MPLYKVIAPGFYEGKYYKPTGKRRTLHTAKPFGKEKLPSWLAEMPKETAAAKKKREAAEKAQAGAEKKQAKEQEKDIEDASFMGAGENATGSSVETL